MKSGTGDPTFTRATTATVTDFEGLIKKVKSGEARFEGARRVENLIPTSSASLTSGNNKTITVTAGTYVFSMGAGASSGVATFSGTGGATGTITQNATNRTSQNFTLTAGTFIVTASVATLVDLQFEQTTGQTISTIPSEYVSVGVLSSPYQGTGADGVQYFTTTNGNTVASHVVTEAVGSAIADATLHGYLVEAIRTNLVKQSEVFKTTWTASNITIADDSVVSPAGTTTADTLTASADNATILQAITGTAVPYTFSVYLKRLTGTGIVSISADGTNFTTCTINASTWTRCSDTRTLTAASYNVTIKLGTNTDAVYVWGAQAELGSFASSYIPTTTLTVQRNTDVLTYPESGNVGLGNTSIYIEYTPEADSTKTGVLYPQLYSLNTVNFNTYRYEINITGSGAIEGGSSYFNLSTVNKTFIAGTKYRIGFRDSSLYIKQFIDGAGGTEAQGQARTALGSTINVGFWPSDSGRASCGTVRNFNIWTHALSDAELIDMTRGILPLMSYSLSPSSSASPSNSPSLSPSNSPSLSPSSSLSPSASPSAPPNYVTIQTSNGVWTDCYRVDVYTPTGWFNDAGESITFDGINWVDY